MKKFYSLVIILILSINIYAQWTKIGYQIVNTTDTSKGCNVIKGFSNIVYCGTNRGLFKSSDNGDSWTNISYTAGPTANENIYSVHVATNGTMFIGSSKKLFKSTDQGNSWTWINSLPDSSIYYDIAEIGGNIIVSFEKSASNYGCYYSSDQGVTWNLSTGLTSFTRRFLVNGINLYVGGTSNGVYKSTDNGKSWTLLNSGFPALAGIWNVEKVGSKLFASSAGAKGLFESSDEGITWTASSPSVFNGFCQVFSMAKIGNTILTSVDGACNNSSGIKISQDGGGTWSGFIAGIDPAGFSPILGKNSSQTSFFTKKGNGGEVFRYNVASSPSTISNSNSNKIEVYPNPAHDILHIGYDNPSNLNFMLFDYIGRVLVQTEIRKNENQPISLSKIPEGHYFYKITNENNEESFGKLKIENK